jgi:hypothetical protein
VTYKIRACPYVKKNFERLGKNKIQKRLYSTSTRKTLTSPESRPYADLYKGRGKPINEPE